MQHKDMQDIQQSSHANCYKLKNKFRVRKHSLYCYK